MGLGKFIKSILFLALNTYACTYLGGAILTLLAKPNPTLPQAEFIERTYCINCGSTHLKEISKGLFTANPLCDFINRDPWGENPLAYLHEKTWIFVECVDCHQRFHKQVLSEKWNDIRFSQWMTQEAIEAFEQEYRQTHKEQRFSKVAHYVEHVLKIEKLTRKLRGQESVRILDFGCGWGDFLAVCEQFGFQSYGIDRSQERRKQSHCSIIADSITELLSSIAPIKQFHAITLFEVLEHLDNPSAVLKELHGLLMTGGVLVLETPNCEGISSVNTLYEYRQIHPLDHINAFTPETLQSIAERTGFRLITQPTTHVTCDEFQIVKTELKRILHPLRKRNTQLYFVKK